jgi:hypothetical protein
LPEADTKKIIKSALQSFGGGDLSQKSLKLYQTLSYNTERQNPFSEKTYRCFKESYLDGDTRFSEVKALVPEWKYVDLLFQLSKDEITPQHGLFVTKRVDRTIIETYLFFVIELSKDHYSRTTLSQITRELNKVFPMPVMVLFKYGQSLTLAVINRRLHKRDERKDVLEKVTLIKDISIENPHRAHIEILFDLSFSELLRVNKFSNFVELHHAWQKTLDTKELNKRFYQELANWYFWAMEHVSFPDDVEKNKDIRNATSLIRLITRIIFIWFIKEKDLVPEALFDRTALDRKLKEFAKNKKSNSYYQAILQNLFFGTLNQKMNERSFAKEGSFEENRTNYGVKNLFRYANHFAVSEKEALALFKDIPFLNGGLFDCLDKENDEGKVLYSDGFSRNPHKQAMVPDFLFFGAEEEYDLNAIYGTKNKRYKVKGLIDILSGYKFTVAENTPVEEEVALDPELLGKVFENLLASYNPETQTTARKQTGSFYTPREIVDYMVEEALIAYLKMKLEVNRSSADNIEERLRHLFAYNDEDHLFSTEEVDILIDAIDHLKALDPAVGSGAFPMGILHKLVHILHKLDAKNEQWKERQIQKARQIDDPSIRDHLIADIESAFESNELDYGRKLYLIENCIYGVDIQPIAVQIAKLRFFISLVVDQSKQPGKENLGIRSLPNLETKFVAANTLIGLEKPKAQRNLFENKEIITLEENLKELRHRYFSAKTRKEKMACQKEDKTLRQKIAKLLVHDGWAPDSAKQIVAFDPYDQNASSPFFDPEWMFGLKEENAGDGVFDVVIANPPYIEISGISEEQRNIYKALFKTATGRFDLYLLFIEKTMQIKNKTGGFVFIIPGKFLNNKQFASTRKLVSNGHNINVVKIDDKVFEAQVDSVIIQNHTAKNPNEAKYKTFKISGNEVSKISSTNVSQILQNKDVIFKLELNSKTDELISKIEQDSKRFIEIGEVKDGIIAGLIKDILFVSKKINKDCKPLYFGKQINRYYTGETNVYVDYRPDYMLKEELNKKGGGAPGLRMRGKKIFERKKILYRKVGKELIATFDDTGVYYEQTIHSACVTDKSVNNKFILGLFNSTLFKFYYHKSNSQGGDTFPQVRISSVENLPIKIATKEKQASVQVIVDYILILKALSRLINSTFFERLIDAMVVELYLPGEIKAAGCEVLIHLTNLPELKDGWSDDQKQQTIEKVSKELSDPAHPVSVAMEKMKTVPEVRIIEGLDKE